MRRCSFSCVLSLACSVALLCSSSASAGPPCCANSTIPATISLVGHDGTGQPDPIGYFSVTYRDFANNPVQGAEILVDFEGCPDAQIALVQQPGVTVTCPLGVTAITDARGVVEMSLIGKARSGPPVSGQAQIYANGELLGNCAVAIFDLDGGDGVHGSDLSVWIADFISGANPARSNYDGVGTVGGGDLSVWARVFINAKSIAGVNSLGGVCP